MSKVGLGNSGIQNDFTVETRVSKQATVDKTSEEISEISLKPEDSALIESKKGSIPSEGISLEENESQRIPDSENRIKKDVKESKVKEDTPVKSAVKLAGAIALPTGIGAVIGGIIGGAIGAVAGAISTGGIGALPAAILGAKIGAAVVGTIGLAVGILFPLVWWLDKHGH